MKKGIIALVALAFVLAIVVPAMAEDPARPRRHSPSPPRRRACARNSSSSNTSGPRTSMNLLYAYVSRDGHIQFKTNMPNVLTVSDTAGERREDPGRHPRARRQARRHPLIPSSWSWARRPTPRPTLSSRTTPSSRNSASSSDTKAIRSSMRLLCGPSTGRARRSSSDRKPSSSSRSSPMSPGTPRHRSSRPRSVEADSNISARGSRESHHQEADAGRKLSQHQGRRTDGRRRLQARRRR